MTGIPFPDWLSPIAFDFNRWGLPFQLRWYALAYIVGILIGWWITRMALKRPKLWPNDTSPMTPEQLDDFLTWIVVGIIGGGRLGYVLFYEPSVFIAEPWRIPFIWEGGMSFHGGFLGVCLAIVLWCRKHGVALWSGADAIALATPPALLLGRISNFVNAELWGRETTAPWGVIFPGPAAQTCPTQAAGSCARHPSQLSEAGLEGLLLLILVLFFAFARGWLRRPASITALVLIGYGAARVFVEFFRQPDAQFVSPGNPIGFAVHVDGYGLTMGQFLSLPMIVVGLGLWLWARRKAAP